MNIAYIISFLVVGLVLMLLEIFVIPGIGIAGILGVIALVAGCYFTFGYGTTIGLITTGGTILVLTVLLIYAMRAKTWKKVALEEKVESSAGQKASAASVGQQGITTTRLAPMGSARIEGVLLEVKSSEGMLDAGTPVEVSLVEDDIIYVKTIK